MVPICNTSLGAPRSMDEVTCSRLDLPGGNFLGKSSGRPCRVLPNLVLACLALGPLLRELLFEGRGP